MPVAVTDTDYRNSLTVFQLVPFASGHGCADTDTDTKTWNSGLRLSWNVYNAKHFNLMFCPLLLHNAVLRAMGNYRDKIILISLFNAIDMIAKCTIESYIAYQIQFPQLINVCNSSNSMILV